MKKTAKDVSERLYKSRQSFDCQSKQNSIDRKEFVSKIEAKHDHIDKQNEKVRDNIQFAKTTMKDFN